MNEEIRKLNDLIKAAKRIVFFGGAGVSTESGIPDFRSIDGLYSQRFKYPPEYMLSHTFFKKHTEEFFKFYRAKMLAPELVLSAAGALFVYMLVRIIHGPKKIIRNRF